MSDRGERKAKSGRLRGYRRDRCTIWRGRLAESWHWRNAAAWDGNRCEGWLRKKEATLFRVRSTRARVLFVEFGKQLLNQVDYFARVRFLLDSLCEFPPVLDVIAGRQSFVFARKQNCFIEFFTLHWPVSLKHIVLAVARFVFGLFYRVHFRSPILHRGCWRRANEVGSLSEDSTVRLLLSSSCLH